MITYTAQMETAVGDGLHGTQLRNRNGSFLAGPIPFGAIVIFAVALSVIFPYGIGVAVAAWVIALAGALMGAGFASYLLLKELLGRRAIFGYSPATAYLAGKRTNKAGRGGK